MSSFLRCIFEKKVFLILCLNLFGFSSNLHSFGKLFQIFGPIYEALFNPIFVDFKGSFNFWNYVYYKAFQLKNTYHTYTCTYTSFNVVNTKEWKILIININVIICTLNICKKSIFNFMFGFIWIFF